MTRLLPIAATACAALLPALILSVSAQAQTVLEPFDDAVIRDHLCLGEQCTDDFDVIDDLSSTLLIRDTRVRIDFEDTSADGDIFPKSDWTLFINDTNSNGDEYFAIRDRTANTVPLRIDSGAPNNALRVAANGNVGFGTSMPQDPLHIVDITPRIRFEDTGVNPAQTWQITASEFAYFVRDGLAATDPFVIYPGAPNFAMTAASDGNVGLGLAAPEGKLHTRGNGVQLVYFESGNGGPVQVRFRTDSENRRFLAVDNDNNVKSQIIFLDDRINFTGQTDSGANLWLSIGPDGIVSQGPTCGTPCDLTFDPDVFTVDPIKTRAAYMWKNMHLPAIGPTSPDTPLNLTEKTGGIIHELEIAHIYIEQLHDELAAVKQDHARQLAELTARLDAMAQD